MFSLSVRELQISIGFLVPPLVVFLAKHPIVDKYKLTLKDVFSGAAPLGGELVMALKKRLKVPFVRQGYYAYNYVLFRS